IVPSALVLKLAKLPEVKPFCDRALMLKLEPNCVLPEKSSVIETAFAPVVGVKLTVGTAGTVVGAIPVPLKVITAVVAGRAGVDMPSAVVYTFQTPGPDLTKKLCTVCALPKL